MTKKVTELSLFTGMGGGIYGSLILGWQTLAYVERDEYCQKVIKQRIKDGWFDHGHVYGDIKEFNKKHAAKYTGKVDVLTGGFPCQPFSVAGKRKGTSDERYLFDEIIKTIKIVQPRRLLFENVPGILSSNAIIEIYKSLNKIGYRPKAPLVIGSADCGNIHRRQRVWIFADSESFRDTRRQSKERGHERLISQQNEQERHSLRSKTSGCSIREIHDSNTSSCRCNGGQNNRQERHIHQTKIGEFSQNQSKRSQCINGADTHDDVHLTDPKLLGRIKGICNQKTTSNQQEKPKTTVESDPQINPLIRRKETICSIDDLVQRPDIPQPLLCGVVDELSNWSQQLKATGNGQDPIVMATAWRILSGDNMS